MADRRTNSQADHDLIIEIHTKVSRLIDDVKDLKDNTTKRISDLEDNKVSRIEFEKLSDVVVENKTFIDNLKGKYAVIGVLIAAAISVISAWIVKNS